MDCGTAPDLVKGEKSLSTVHSTHVTNTSSYTCRENYVFENNQPEPIISIECLDDGNWEAFADRCIGKMPYMISFFIVHTFLLVELDARDLSIIVLPKMSVYFVNIVIARRRNAFLIHFHCNSQINTIFL